MQPDVVKLRLNTCLADAPPFAYILCYSFSTNSVFELVRLSAQSVFSSLPCPLPAQRIKDEPCFLFLFQIATIYSNPFTKRKLLLDQ